MSDIELTNDQLYAIMSLEPWWHDADSKQVFSISGAAGTGKAQPVSTTIPTPNGYKKLGDIKVGDYVYDKYSFPTKVLGVYPQGELEVYEIELDDGRSTRCSIDHLWNVRIGNTIQTSTHSLKELMNIEDDIRVPVTDKKIHIPYYVKLNAIRDLGYKEEMVCIYVDDSEHLYITNDYIITHNTTVIKYFIDRIGLDYDNVYFLAYMGKAVSQLQKNGLPGKTIHSAIYDYKEEYERDENGKLIIKKNGKPKKRFYFDLKPRLPKKIKLIVVDEGSMVPEDIAEDLMSFGIPIVVLGDLNQLPPIFGESIFLRDPDVILKQIMRQKEGDPIIWLAQRVLDGLPLNKGVYGNSAVIDKKELNEFNFRNANIVITGTNRLRYKINNFYREHLRDIKRLEYPHVGEKVICRKNNWNESIDGIFLTNGTAGYVTDIKHDSFDNISMKMDFRPDFTDEEFTDLRFDYYHMYNMEPEKELGAKYAIMKDKLNIFEYAYALTVHSVQGSTYGNVLFLADDAFGDKEFRKKFMYTGITRASNSITIVL